MQSKRLGELPPYLFVEIDRKKEALVRGGREVLDLGIGDPDLGACHLLRDSLRTAIDNLKYDRYPPDRGLPVLVEAIRSWAKREHGTVLENDEILVTIGSKEAIAHLPLAVADQGDIVLVPDPGYPVYNSSAVFAGAAVHKMPLLSSNRYWPDLGAIDKGVLRRAKVAYFNYPNNPTSATASEGMFADALEFCSKNGIVMVNDAAYSEIIYDGRWSGLFPVAKRSGASYIEFFSFSKTFSITGWRVGFAVGSSDVISALARLKTNIDSGVFGSVQKAVASVLNDHFEEVRSEVVARYRERRDLLASSLDKAGFVYDTPEATFYFWVPVPGGGGSSIDFCGHLMEKTGIVATPGVGFGRNGEGYFRLSVTSPTETIREAGKRIIDFTNNS
ncbi:MAG: aminotransferase class I/II-fold pyridoxal phosphate-dependent enzyme [Candidatus Krumholzibacteriota bacterium]|nr:aminotransferase class I/II-fold pyridoxal phosphate-dependent enzyme [Candidatus Krumholzibacteriota bacterium]